MKKIMIIMLAAMLLAGCSSQNEKVGDGEATVSGETAETISGTAIESSQDTAENSETVAQPEESIPESTEEVPQPIYADALVDGSYKITVDSSYSMFRVVECILTVENGQMSAVMTMSGNGYGMVYMGTGEEALVDSEENYIPFILNENEMKDFTVPVEALDMEVDCAAWSIRKEKWYDRVLVFESEGLPAEAFKAEQYTVEVSLVGGTGRAEVESPANVVIEGDSITATIVWSSPFYEYMLIGDTKYDPIQEDGNSTFRIPIVLDEDMAVSASTIAMSQPHLIEYTLHFEGSTLEVK